MRTTVSIDDELLAAAKVIAARSGRTLSDVVEDALREAQARRAVTLGPRRVDLKTFDGGGTRPGVDLNSNAALLDLMDRDAAPRD